jgi:hypothetical protein
MKESDFGKQYFSIFGSAKDTVAANVSNVCRQEKIDDRVAQKIVLAAQASIEQTATNAYPSLWGQIQKFFRK